MENKIRQTLNAIYFGKTKDILNSLRNSESAQNRARLQQVNFTVHASTSYWKILAERTRIKLEEQLRENRQLHELYDELIQENEQLQVKSDKCEYLTNIFNSIMSEHDSGLELNITGESSDSKQEK
ncbi:unnamed protein product [Rotaria magnacalcarata]|uniref:Geminin n=1 Tax=Rotaria magnacalcarata TaxID=392030 RepID=A0A8S2Q389_9BILA|nr:unnamed protein product [Rotaria magnacalcarata]